MSPNLKVRTMSKKRWTMSKNSKERFVDTFSWKATSTMDAIAHCAAVILANRRMVQKITPPVANVLIFVCSAFIALCCMANYMRTGDLSHMIGFLGAFYLAGFGKLWYESVYAATKDIYDWAEEWEDLIEERRAFRREEYEKDLPRRKF